MGLWRYAAWRLVQIAFTMWVVVTLIFIIFRLMPGDPTKVIIDPKMTPEAKAILRKTFGLDKPLHIQYLYYLRNILRGEFGKSFYYGEDVWAIIKRRIGPTLLLFLVSVVLQYAIGIYVGRIMAWKRGSTFDSVMTFVGLFFYTVFLPWYALILLWIFSYKLNLFPLGGMVTPEIWIQKSVPLWRKILDVLHHLVLPWFTLLTISMAGSMLLMRNSMLEVMREDFVLTARAKGLDDRTIRNRHVARNAMLPVVTAFALSLAFSVSGGVLTETVFSWPGLGREIVIAVLNYDYPLAQAAFILLAGLVLTMNLVADILYAFLDPRIRY